MGPDTEFVVDTPVDRMGACVSTVGSQDEGPGMDIHSRQKRVAGGLSCLEKTANARESGSLPSPCGVAPPDSDDRPAPRRTHRPRPRPDDPSRRTVPTPGEESRTSTTRRIRPPTVLPDQSGFQVYRVSISTPDSRLCARWGRVTHRPVYLSLSRGRVPSRETVDRPRDQRTVEQGSVVRQGV